MNLYSLQTNNTIGNGQVVEYLPGRKGKHIDWVRVVNYWASTNEVLLSWPDGDRMRADPADIGAYIGNKRKKNSLAGGHHTCGDVGPELNIRKGSAMGKSEAMARDMSGARAGTGHLAYGVYNTRSKVVRDEFSVASVETDITLMRDLQAVGARPLGGDLWQVDHTCRAPDSAPPLHTLQVTGPERDAILAGLRLLAREVKAGNVKFADADDIGHIWTCDGEHDGLAPDQIHALADRLNGG